MPQEKIVDTNVPGQQTALLPLYWRRRFKIALHNLRCDRSRRILVSRSGVVFRLRVGEEHISIASISRWSKYRNGVSAQLNKLAQRYGVSSLTPLMKNKTVIDVGSNIGEFGLYCDRAGARVIALEPDPINYSSLAENIQGTGIKAFQVALWDTNEKLTFYSSVLRADSSLIKPSQYSQSLEVEAMPLDQLAHEHCIGNVFLLKADAEGAEPELLRGATATLSNTCFVSIDCGPERQGAKTFEACEKILRGYGFKTQAFDMEGNIILGTNPKALADSNALEDAAFPADWPFPH
ncbi:MAG: FkbM family methyltransferase [Chromatiaceae bacterium]|nr:FkbM family methyltransferase [Chromatiaceae bacterium]MCF7993915.1 FkbM family methyltransferase [Chromatiaceae bacterium]